MVGGRWLLKRRRLCDLFHGDGSATPVLLQITDIGLEALNSSGKFLYDAHYFVPLLSMGLVEGLNLSLGMGLRSGVGVGMVFERVSLLLDEGFHSLFKNGGEGAFGFVFFLGGGWGCCGRMSGFLDGLLDGLHDGLFGQDAV